MAKRASMVVLAVMAVVGLGLIHGSLAQQTHVVGNVTGWIVPPGGAAFYTAWAAMETFTVGDILEFNFATGNHDVAKVTKTAFDNCNSNSPISLVTNGPANITLNSTGEHFFICTIGQHCSNGQKLAINVSASTATPPPASAPQPSAPPPSSTATPPSTTATPPPTSSAGPPTATPGPNAEPSPEGGSTPPPPPPPPPPAGSAPSFAAAGFSFSVLSVVAALLI